MMKLEIDDTFHQILKGMEILATGAAEPYDRDINAEHDEIFVMAPGPKEFSEENCERLEELGWVFDEDLPSWRHFV